MVLGKAIHCRPCGIPGTKNVSKKGFFSDFKAQRKCVMSPVRYQIVRSGVHIPGYPAPHSNDIRPPKPGYLITCDALL